MWILALRADEYDVTMRFVDEPARGGNEKLRRNARFVAVRADVGSCAAESRTCTRPVFSWLRIASETSLSTVWKAALARACLEIGEPGG